MEKAASLPAKENRRLRKADDNVDIPFLTLVLLLLSVGLIMLYSASCAQSEYDTLYESSVKYLQKQAICAIIGLFTMYLFIRIPFTVWYRLR